jgi:hypothetical protein
VQEVTKGGLGRYVMKMRTGAVGAALVALGVGITACGAAPVIVMRTPAAHSTAAATAASPARTKTIVKYRTVAAAPTPSAAPTTAAAAPPAAPPAPAPRQPADQNVTDAWAVVSAYYGDIESGNYAQAYALIGNGSTTGQSYQQFASGFSCTGSQAVSENWDSGDQVNFNLAAGDTCTGAITYYTGTDTVNDGIIVAANVVQTG